MEKLSHLGSALRQLRELAGLGIDSCAAKVNLRPDELRRAEEGFLGAEIIERLAALFGMQREELESGALVQAQERGTVFLLQGSYQDFNAEDLAVLCAAMNEGRIMSALDGGAASFALRRRLQFMPVRVAGPNPKDAAQQGHKLARLVRSRLGLGAGDIGDIRELLEDKLGIAVRVDDLVSLNLRAASIVDANRSAAAAVLAASHPERERNPLLARVYLAHELGHVLFDPAAPGTVRLALEDLSVEARGNGRITDDALLESRAKGFAAELLLPFEGLRSLLGVPQQILNISLARSMVNKARETFGTPFEIAARHLTNLGFLHSELWENALRQPLSPIQGHETRLPQAREGSLRLRSLVAGGQANIANDAADVLASRARESAAHASARALDELIEKSLIAAQEKRVLAATDLLVEQLDDLLTANELNLAGVLLDKVDPNRFPPPVLTGLLTVISHAPDEINRARFRARVWDALRTTWTWDEVRITSLQARLG
jgi:IrrE N-terminal-like domain